MEEEFQLGIYRHYKGGIYTAIMVVQHHETREPMVVYVSHERGSINVRPLRGSKRDPDGFRDELSLPGSFEHVRRFEYVGPARS